MKGKEEKKRKTINPIPYKKGVAAISQHHQ
jgi:hypothetical protein